MLKIGNILPFHNWDMTQKVISQRSWPWKVKVISQKIYGTIRFLDLNNIYLHAKIIILSALVQKLWSQMSFRKMVANAMHWHTSHFHTTQDICWFIERPRFKLLCVKVWWQFIQEEPRYGPKYDFTGLWPWKVKVIREGQNNFYQTLATTQKYTCEVSSKSYHHFFDTVFQSLIERWPGKERRNMTETLWLMLTLCNTNYAMKERPDVKWPGNNLRIFPWAFTWYELGLNTLSRYGLWSHQRTRNAWSHAHLHSWRRRIMEIEPPKLCLKST